MEHFTPQQRIWLTTRRRARGRAHLLIRVADDWLLFDGLVAAKVLGHKPKAELMRYATARWVGSPDWTEMWRLLLGRPLAAL